MLGGIATPRSPGLRALEQLESGGCHSSELCGASQDAEIRGGECIWLTQGAKGDILSGPFTDAADGTELRDTLLDRPLWHEQSWIGRCCVGQRLYRGPACRRHADSAQVGGGEAAGRGKRSGEGCIVCVEQRISVQIYQLAA